MTHRVLCCIPGCENMSESEPYELRLCSVHKSLPRRILEKLVPELSRIRLEPAPAQLVPTTDAATKNERGGGLKYDAGKPRPALLMQGMPVALSSIVDVLTFGAKKYEAHSWRSVENGLERYTDAMYRHLEAHAKGEKVDEESGLPHLAHAACDLLFIMELERTKELKCEQ